MKKKTTTKNVARNTSHTDESCEGTKVWNLLEGAAAVAVSDSSVRFWMCVHFSGVGGKEKNQNVKNFCEKLKCRCGTNSGGGERREGRREKLSAPSPAKVCCCCTKLKPCSSRCTAFSAAQLGARPFYFSETWQNYTFIHTFNRNIAP